jgi:hypothetical protein
VTISATELDSPKPATRARPFLGVANAAALMIFGACMSFFVVSITAGAAISNGISRNRLDRDPIVATVCLTAVGATGFITARGLLRFRPWARIATIGYGGMFTASAIAAWIAFHRGLRPPVAGPLDALYLSMHAAQQIGAAFAGIVFLATGTWWLLYFNRDAIRTGFKNTAVAWNPDRRPLSVIVIAWFMIWTGVDIFNINFTSKLLRHTGIAAGVWSLTSSALLWVLYLAAGIAILRALRWGLWVAIALESLEIGSLLEQITARYLKGQGAGTFPLQLAAEVAGTGIILGTLFACHRAYSEATSPGI